MALQRDGGRLAFQRQGKHFGQLVFRQGADHIRIYNISVGFHFIRREVFVGPDFVVCPRMLAQVEQAIPPQLAHARLEVAAFVFVGNDAHKPILRILLFRLRKGVVPPVFVQKQRAKAKIRF